MSPRPAAVRGFLALLVLLAALDLVVLAIRLADVASLGRLFLFPAEGPVLYAIWKVGHGHPLYEFPFRPPFTLTLYNFLFYRTYAAIFSVLRIGTDAVPIAGRWITLVFAALGAVGQCAAGRPAGRRCAACMPSGGCAGCDCDVVRRRAAGLVGARDPSRRAGGGDRGVGRRGRPDRVSRRPSRLARRGRPRLLRGVGVQAVASRARGRDVRLRDAGGGAR